ncbi:MAG: stage II sporulation protein P [Clostridia bacterium]|nr:stage II sporulation protein P [Clostridia bacterium]
MNGTIGKHCLRAAALLLCVAALPSMIHALPPEEWMAVGQAAVIAAASLQQPEAGLRYLQTQWTASTETPKAQNREVTAPKPEAASTEQAEEAAASPIPPKGPGGGAVKELQLDTGKPAVGAVAVKNNSGVSYDLAALFAAGSPVSIADTAEPQVLIVHTHTTESYMSYYAGYYNDDDATRSTEESDNVVAVGEAIAAGLESQGVGVVHSRAVHDDPEFSGAYVRSEATILRELEAHPSIRVVLDIHRDAMMADDRTKYKPTVTIAGRKAAQMMLVIGATDTEDLPNAYCSENIRFGLQLQQTLASNYDGLMRPILLEDARYNQGLRVGSLLIEVGTDANTLSEAVFSGRLLGASLGEMLRGSQPNERK